MKPLFPILSALLLFTTACSVSLGGISDKDSVLHLGVILEGSDTNSADMAIVAALEQAEADITEMLQRPLKVHFAETAGNPNRALEALSGFAESGIRYIVGPETSAEAAYLLSFATKGGTVLISHSSTAPYLHTPDDSLFRLVPNDTLQAEFLAAGIKEQGATDLVIIARNDIYGQQLSSLTAEQFLAQGGRSSPPLLYSPTIDPELWPDMITVLDSTLKKIYSQPNARPAILVAGFDELSTLFARLHDNPLAGKAMWFGSEALADNDALLHNEKARSFLEKVGAKFATFTSEDAEALGKSGHPLAGLRFEALAAYDALTLAALAEAKASDSATPKELRKALSSAAKNYRGLTGPTELGAEGDRENVSFKFWSISPSQE